MPKSKRDRVVALTKTKKKGKEWKEGLVTQVRNCVDQYPAVYLFKHFNMRTEHFKDLREEHRETSKIVMGSNKLLQVALGKSDADEYRTNLHLLSERMKGQVALFFTSLKRQEVEEVFSGFSVEDYARAGAKAAHDFRLPEGPLSGPSGPLPHTLEPQLRKYGMPTKLNKGVVELIADFTVCSKGQVLDANQAAILRVFDIKMTTARIKLLACWDSEGDKFEELAEDDGSEGADLDMSGDLLEEDEEQ
mmetsp:Transcript_30976/g.68654  ORF Transcript_30976/g.68654 Transcript_30976/m.68654 type:complete len:248 (+) Transcript_30976:190-933(+)|eukprot:CAMPEP_0202897644 /NCGR_PEP_ID=MMETSP1392-20130828/6350_1 /ASSEMBLY_ACC=CAM_ASM_000868 /TAXON_ID=225041 /ORGANISM="Chlamydomonas chlamydogama, Strain SAG 11-48b" /LENGTH=247 /DNA_ID=CAMNT_0049583331 /DNA_START=175 /DNA_END=918 /DNA_ORIENTATION=-